MKRVIALITGLVLMGIGFDSARAQTPPPQPPLGGQPQAGARRPGRRRMRQHEPGQQPMRRLHPGDGLGGQAGGGWGQVGANFLERLRREDPEEFQRLSALYREDRQSFMKEARALLRERGEQMMRGRGGGGPRTSQEEQKCHELARLYHEAENDDDKAAIRQELEVAVQHAFEVRLENSRQRIANLEAQLAKFREHIATLEENREQICKGRIDELTRPPELKWEGRW